MTAPSSRRLDAAALREWMETPESPRVLDVRTPAEFEAMHIPGSYNVPLDTLREHREEIQQHLETDVVLVCRSGQRAAQAEQALAELGMPNLHVLDGGILGWEGAGAPVRRGRQRWDLERQVRLVAGSIVLLSVLVSLLVPAAVAVAGFVGAGLTVAALTNTCAMGAALSRLPWNRTASCDTDTILAQLAGARP
jgi:rhodanese-related sulfurtransferase